MLKWVLFRHRFEMNASRVTFTRVFSRFICRIMFDLATHNIVSRELGTRCLGKILVWNKIDTVLTKGNQRGGHSSHIHMYGGKNKGIDLVPYFSPGAGRLVLYFFILLVFLAGLVDIGVLHLLELLIRR